MVGVVVDVGCIVEIGDGGGGVLVCCCVYIDG